MFRRSLRTTCVRPSSLSLTSGSTTAFTISVATLGPAVVPVYPLSTPTPTLRSMPFLSMMFLVALIASFLWTQAYHGTTRSRRSATLAATALSLCLIFSGIGCGGGGGGGGSAPPPFARRAGRCHPFDSTGRGHVKRGTNRFHGGRYGRRHHPLHNRRLYANRCITRLLRAVFSQLRCHDKGNGEGRRILQQLRGE